MKKIFKTVWNDLISALMEIVWYFSNSIRKRYLLHKLMGLIGVVCILAIAYVAPDPIGFCFALFATFILPSKQFFVKLFFGDDNMIDIYRSLRKGSWKRDYNSVYNSELSFLVFDPYGRSIQSYVPEEGTFTNVMAMYVGPSMIYAESSRNTWISTRYPDVEIMLDTNNCVHFRLKEIGTVDLSTVFF